MDPYKATVNALIAAKIGYSSGNCYVSALTLDIPGNHPLYAQVVPGIVQGQDNSDDVDELVLEVKVSLFVHMQIDVESRTQEIVVKESTGLLARAAAIRRALNGKYLQDADGRDLLAVALKRVTTLEPNANPRDTTWVHIDQVFRGRLYEKIGVSDAD